MLVRLSILASLRFGFRRPGTDETLLASYLTPTGCRESAGVREMSRMASQDLEISTFDTDRHLNQR